MNIQLALISGISQYANGGDHQQSKPKSPSNQRFKDNVLWSNELWIVAVLFAFSRLTLLAPLVKPLNRILREVGREMYFKGKLQNLKDISLSSGSNWNHRITRSENSCQKIKIHTTLKASLQYLLNRKRSLNSRVLLLVDANLMMICIQLGAL